MSLHNCKKTPANYDALGVLVKLKKKPTTMPEFIERTHFN